MVEPEPHRDAIPVPAPILVYSMAQIKKCTCSKFRDFTSKLSRWKKLITFLHLIQYILFRISFRLVRNRNWTWCCVAASNYSARSRNRILRSTLCTVTWEVAVPCSFLLLATCLLSSCILNIQIIKICQLKKKPAMRNTIYLLKYTKCHYKM
jgi:hypothetical protein